MNIRAAAGVCSLVGSHNQRATITELNWIASLPNLACARGNPHFRGGNWQNDVRSLPPAEGDLQHKTGVVTWHRAPGGKFWCTGRRDPRPHLNPGPPPYSSTTGWYSIDWTWNGEIGGDFLGEAWWKPDWPHTAGRYTHRSQYRSFLWNPKCDKYLIGVIDQNVCALSPEAFDLLIMMANDVEAISQGAIDLCAGDTEYHSLPRGALDSIRPGPCPRPDNPDWKPFGTLSEQRGQLDTARASFVSHLGLAAILLRGVPDKDLVLTLPRRWIYPSFPGGTFYDAIEAYDVAHGRMAGIVLDLNLEPASHPPLSLLAQWGVRYKFYEPNTLQPARSMQPKDWCWKDVANWATWPALEMLRAYEATYGRAQSLPAGYDPILEKFNQYILIEPVDNADSRFEKFLRHVLDGLEQHAEERLVQLFHTRVVTRDEIIRYRYCQRMDYEEDILRGCLLFKSWTDDHYRKNAFLRAKGRGITRTPPPDDDEDSLSDCEVAIDQTLMARLRDHGLRLPSPLPTRPCYGPQLPNHPFPLAVEAAAELPDAWADVLMQSMPPPLRNLRETHSPIADVIVKSEPADEPMALDDPQSALILESSAQSANATSDASYDHTGSLHLNSSDELTQHGHGAVASMHSSAPMPSPSQADPSMIAPEPLVPQLPANTVHQFLSGTVTQFPLEAGRSEPALTVPTIIHPTNIPAGPLRRPVRGPPIHPTFNVCWPTSSAPSSLEGTFDEIMGAIFPPAVVDVSALRPMPIVPHLTAPIGEGWVRFPPATHTRYLAWTRRNTRSINDFIRLAASRGMAFEFGRVGSAQQHKIDAEGWCLPHDLTFAQWGYGLQLLPTHICSEFFRQGGVAWRLMLEYLPSTVVSDALQGPSIHACVPLLGEEQWPANVVVDRPTERQYAILTGRCSDGKSWWPHPDVWDAISSGEWDTRYEKWFSTRIAEGHRGQATRMLDTAWFAPLRRSTPTAVRARLKYADARLYPVLLTLAGDNGTHTLEVGRSATARDAMTNERDTPMDS
ncbi:unnamed protein product [Peniophora sp. CBMAI 1063]|nr:unnamed protein product [Peniophora sp. CBMAI 1063]